MDEIENAVELTLSKGVVGEETSQIVIPDDREEMFISTELAEGRESGVYYYRMDSAMNEFLKKIIEKGKIDGIILTWKPNGDVSYNLGFAVTSKGTNIKKVSS